MNPVHRYGYNWPSPPSFIVPKSGRWAGAEKPKSGHGKARKARAIAKRKAGR